MRKPHRQLPAVADSSAIFELAYAELKRLARHTRRGFAADTLSTTALVHEAFLKVRQHVATANSNEHLKALTTRAMRQILVDHARAERALKRGSGVIAVTLEGVASATSDDAFDLVAVDDALAALDELNPRLAEVVELHVFGGFAMPEIAGLLQITERTVFRDWRKARAFLVDRLG